MRVRFGAPSGAEAGLVITVLLAAACGILLWEPWHGPVVLTLSASHGIDAGDLPALPLIALAVAIGHAWAGNLVGRERWWMGRGARVASAVLLGALLLSVGLDALMSDASLVPAGGGTFAGSTKHVDGQRPEPVGRWSHLAVTYDGLTLRLYVDGTEVSRQTSSGPLLKTSDPLWIGGNRPFGEYFQGVIDEVRVYERALGPAAVRAEMSAPITRRRSLRTAGLVGAYAFDAGSGTVAADSSGKGNAGALLGATWTTRGRFGRAVRFSAAGDVVRVPPSASLNLKTAMTLAAWVRPTEEQAGWRTVVYRQRDAYFLSAGGGDQLAYRLGAVDDARLAVLLVAAVWFAIALIGTAPLRVEWRRFRYWPLVALFLAGSVIDAAFEPADTLIGPALVATWCARTAAHRGAAVSMYVIAAACACVTVLSVGPAGVELWHWDGGVARSAALGLLLLSAGLWTLAELLPRYREPTSVGR
jgi:hypothetical protein